MKKTELSLMIKEAEAEGKRVNLARADLSHEDLSDVDFCGTDLRDATLVGATLTGADLSRIILLGVIGNGREVKTLQTEYHPIVYTKSDMAIGREQHSLKEWYSYTDAEFSEDQDNPENALSFWKKWKPILVAIGVFDSVTT